MKIGSLFSGIGGFDLAAERAEADGILRWIVEGCLDWQREGLGEAPEVAEATRSYREDMDVLAGFLAERCEVGNGFEETASGLYAGYRAWCEANGEKALAQNVFGMRLKEKEFLVVRRTGGKRVWIGIKLRRSDRQEADL